MLITAVTDLILRKKLEPIFKSLQNSVRIVMTPLHSLFALFIFKENTWHFLMFLLCLGLKSSYRNDTDLGLVREYGSCLRSY
jgi:hypothetical protein